MNGVLCVLQARMSSSRLPGKVLKPILGKPMLVQQVERIRRARKLDSLVVATSDEASDAPLAEACARAGIECFRGSLNDVLDRFYQAARTRQPAQVMRLTGDCPLTDPALLDRVIAQHLAEANDYTSNVHDRSYPDGLDVELFRFDVLEAAWNSARTPFEREHVTPWMYRTGPELKRGAVKDEVDRSKWRWTVDYPEDFAFVTAVFEALYDDKPAFGMADIIALLEDRPELVDINAKHA